MINLSKETLSLLDEYCTLLKQIADELEKDQNFTSLISAKKVPAANSFTISEYAFFEIISVVNLSAEHLDVGLKKNLLAFIGIKFYQPRHLKDEVNFTDLIEKDGKEIAEHYYRYGEKVRTYQDSLPKENGILLFPTVLKSSRHHLFDEYSTNLYRLAALVFNPASRQSRDDRETLKTIWQITHNPEKRSSEDKISSESSVDESLEDIMLELNSLIGLKNVKQEVSTLVNFIKIQKERQKIGLNLSKISYHCVFTGSPGTGKTTVARILARIYKKLEVVSSGHFIETDRSGLVAEYAGQTALKVDKVVKSALNGILFIDEAYALIGENYDGYGKEAVATLIKRIEDDRDRLAVILAGYPNEMESFINNNPGLKSRFNRYIKFEDYNANELLEIFKTFCKKADYQLSKKTKSKLISCFKKLIADKDEAFGNGRLSRNLFEKAIEEQANRLALSGSTLTKDLLVTIEPEDIVLD